MPTRLETKRTELAAVSKLGHDLAEKSKDEELAEDEQREYASVIDRAEGLGKEIKRLEEEAALERKLTRIARDSGLEEAKADDEPQIHYKDSVDKFMKSHEFSEFVEKYNHGERTVSRPVEFNAPQDVGGNDPAANLVTSYLPGVTHEVPNFNTPVAALFNQGTVDGSNVTFFKSSVRDGAADYQSALGETKPGPATLSLDVDTEYVVTIASTMQVPAQTLSDLGFLESEVRSLLLGPIGGIAAAEESEMLSGAGGSGELTGVLTLAPDDVTLVGDYTSKSVFLASSEIQDDIGVPADGLICSPYDAFLLATEVGTVDDRPLFGAWGTQWGQNGVGRIAVSRFCPPGQIIVGAFQASNRLIRSSVSITADGVSYAQKSKNLVGFVAEMREALVHRYGKRPYRIVSTGANESS